MNFIAELRKRNVFRVLAAYLVGAWIIMQVVGFVADAAEMPPWTDTLVLILVLIGLPIVFVASWALELTPEGIKKSGSETELEPRPIGPVDYVLIGAVAVVIGLFGWQLIAPNENPARQITQSALEGQSIAVLPFLAISGEQEDVYLGDGLAEELLNVLAQFPELAVAGRTSSFSFRDQAQDIPAIGTALGVAHVLEGSVRRAGDQIRITAQLIRASDGFHVWSGTYDRPFEDILQVQDDIVRQIAQVLTIRLGVASGAPTNARSANPAAYEQYLRGRVLWAERHESSNRSAAIAAFQTATDIDPGFADAWAAVAVSTAYSGFIDDPTERYTAATEAARRALELDEDSVEALVAMSQINLNLNRDWQASEANILRALDLAPNAAFVHYQAGFHYRMMGDFRRMISSFRRAMALDPLNITIRTNALESYIDSGLLAEADQLLTQGGFLDASRLGAERNLAAHRRDADGLRAAFDEGDAVYGETNLNIPEFRDLVIAWAEGDMAMVQEIMPDALAETEALGNIGPYFADTIYQVSGHHREAAELMAAVTEPTLLDDVIYQNMFPREIGYLCQPAYHEIWARPGMAELAEIRRANGATANLPMSGPECEPYLEAAE